MIAISHPINIRYYTCTAALLELRSICAFLSPSALPTPMYLLCDHTLYVTLEPSQPEDYMRPADEACTPWSYRQSRHCEGALMRVPLSRLISLHRLFALPLFLQLLGKPR